MKKKDKFKIFEHVQKIIEHIQNFSTHIKIFEHVQKILDVLKNFGRVQKILALLKNFEHIFFFKFFPFLAILHNIQIFGTHPKNFEHVRNFSTHPKFFEHVQKILDGADGQGINMNFFDPPYAKSDFNIVFGVNLYSRQ